MSIRYFIDSKTGASLGTFLDFPDDWEGPDGSIEVGSLPSPTDPEEIRARLPNLTARQFWMAAAMINIDKDVIIATVKANMEDSIDRKIVLAELETSTFERKSETIAEIMAMLEIPDEQVDTLWVWASTI